MYTYQAVESFSYNEISANLAKLKPLQNAKGHLSLEEFPVSSANISFLFLQFLLFFFTIEHSVNELSLMMVTPRLPMILGLS